MGGAVLVIPQEVLEIELYLDFVMKKKYFFFKRRTRNL